MSVGQRDTVRGRRVVQHHGYCVAVSMDEYVKNKLRPIGVPKRYLSNTKEGSEGMLTNIKGVNGCWAAPHSIIPSGYDQKSSQLISEVNAAVRQCHAVPITITTLSCAEQRSPTQVLIRVNDRDINKDGWCVP